MFEFAWPWMFLLLPLPLLVWYLMPPLAARHGSALRIPYLDDFSAVAADEISISSSKLPLILLLLGWLALVTATARPVWVGEAVEISRSGRDLMLAIDLSGSMQQQDFQVGRRRVDRLTATKAVAGEFIKMREGDRIGLILFGTRAYLQAPLTFDRKTVKQLLDESFIGMADQDTAIGDAIGLAIKQLRKQEDRQQVLILMTDGTNTAGRVTPLEAARMAAQEGLKIYTVGIGSISRTRRGLFGMRARGRSDLDEKTLKAIAKETGGQYFRAHNTQEFARIYEELDRLEPVEKELESYRPKRDLFQWPLLLFMLLGSITLWLRKNR
ncbi:MAG: VWA domain-containing protein [Pseudomonadota bacterium]|nr:VWA domain-containing protein [Pseudomonadota bacterium]